MEKEVNSFGKGLNKDVDISLQPNDTLREAYGFRLLSFEGSSFVATNIKGTERKSALPDNYIPLACAVSDDICFIFSYNSVTKKGQIGCFPSPIYPNVLPPPNGTLPDLPLEYTYKPLYNYVVSNNRVAFDTDLFSFKEYNNLQVECRLDYDNSFNLYFTDYDNNIRVINTGLCKQENGLYKLSDRVYTYKNFSDIINLILSSDSLLNIDYVRQIDNGKLRHGTYIYHIRYSQDTFNKTDFLASSFPVFVYESRNETIAKGSEDSDLGNNNFVFGSNTNTEEAFSSVSNVIQLNGVDTQFKYFHVFVEYIGGVNNEVRSFYEINNPFEITGNTIEFTHTGNELVSTFSDNELNRIYASISKVKSIAQNDSRLLLFNTLSKESESFYDLLKNFSERIEIRHRKRKINTQQIPDFTYVFNPNGGFISTPSTLNINNAGYRDAFHIYYNLGYHYGEIYQFGVQYIFKDNTFSSVFLLSGRDDLNYNTSFSPINNNKGIYRFPKRNANGFDGSSNTSNKHSEDIEIIVPDFIIPNWNTILSGLSQEANDFVKNNVLGLRFVRIPRKKDAFSQGYLLPTYKFPFLKWGDSNNREIDKFLDNFARTDTNADKYVYYNSDEEKYWYQLISAGHNNSISFLRDSNNVMRNVPLPMGYIEGNGVDSSNNYLRDDDLWSAIMGEHLHDPFRYAFISSDVTVNEAAIANIINQNNISFEVVSGCKIIFSDWTHLGDDIGNNSNVKRAIPTLIRPLDFSSYQGDGLFFKGKSYFVWGDRNARNERFSSVIDAVEGGGIKFIINPSDNWICPDNISFNSYVGLRIGDGNIDNIGNALNAFLNNTSLNFRDNFVRQFYTEPNPLSTSRNVIDAVFCITNSNNSNINKFYTQSNNSNTVAPFTDSIVVVDLFLSENGRASNIVNFYDEFTEGSFFFPVTKNLSLQTIQANGYRAEGVNGDNYQGTFYRKIFYRNYKADAGSGLGERRKRGGITILLKCDNNFNPYSRIRELVSIGDADLMSERSEGNRRSFYPVYANDKITNDITPTKWFTNSVYKKPVREALWKWSKTYYTEEAKHYLAGNNVQDTFRRVNSLFVKKPLSIQSYFPTRVYYSSKHITNSFFDNYRAIDVFAFQDYDISLGAGTAIKVLNNQVYIIQENGVSMLSFNERQFVGENDSVYINTNSVLSPYQGILSRKFGSQHIDSVIATDNSIYFVDVRRRAICRIAGNAVEILSDNRLSSFLEKILPAYDNKREIQSNLTIRSYYNKKYNEVLFIFTNLYNENSQKSHCLVYTEKIDAFIFHPYIPQLAFNIYNDFYSISDLEKKLLSNVNDLVNSESIESVIYQNDVSELRNNFYGENTEMYFHYIVNKNFEIQKIFDNIAIVSNHILPTKLYYKVVDEQGNVLEDIIEYVNGIPTNVINNIVNRLKYREHTVRGSIAYSNKGGNTTIGRRNRDKAIEIGVYYNTNDFLSISRIITSFRYSFS